MESFWTGVAAGYGIAIPVGAIAVLIVELGITQGFRSAFFAGAGAATADFLYSALAVLGGAALAQGIGSFERPIRLVSGLVLGLIAGFGLWRIPRRRAQPARDPAPLGRPAVIFSRFLGLTIINPMTVTYFVAVIIGMDIAGAVEPNQALLFVGGAFIASLSWQTAPCRHWLGGGAPSFRERPDDFFPGGQPADSRTGCGRPSPGGLI